MKIHATARRAEKVHGEKKTLTLPRHLHPCRPANKIPAASAARFVRSALTFLEDHFRSTLTDHVVYDESESAHVTAWVAWEAGL